MLPAPPRFREALRRGLARRCPVCGRGRVFRTLLRLRRSCPDCGWILEREPGAVTGAMYVVAILGQCFAVLVLGLLWLLTNWTVTVQMLVALPLISLFCLWMLPVSKGIWIAIDYTTDVATGKTMEPDYANKAYDRRRGD